MIIKLLFINANGFSQEKQRTINELIMTGSIDLAMVAETWHVDSQYLHTLPSFLFSSPKTKIRTGVRQTGGLCVLAHPLHHKNTRLFSSTDKQISFFMFKNILSCIYLPPSMSSDAFGQALQELPNKPHVLVGDFNIRNLTTPRDKATILSAWAQENEASCKNPTTQCHLDLVFARHDVTVTSTLVEKSPIPSDHRAIYCTVDIPTAAHQTSNESAGLRRYFISKIDIAITQQLSSKYNELREHLSRLLMKPIVGLNVEERQELVDQIDAEIVRVVQQTAESTLGSYLVSSARAAPDRMANKLANTDSILAAAQLFKRMKRANACKLASSKPGIPLEEEVAMHYSSLYSIPESSQAKCDYQRQGSYPHLQQNRICQHNVAQLGIGDYRLSSYFSCIAVAEALHQYPIHKTCGYDGLHVRLLRSIEGLPLDLSRLYQMSALTGLTPRRWNESVSHPLPKVQNKEWVHIGETRSIALTPMFRRVFEKILLKYLYTDPATRKLRDFHPAQAGFQHGNSCILQSILSNDMAHEAIYRVFIDYQKAYDSVNLDTLLHTMEARSAPCAIRSLTMALYGGCTTKVALQGSLSRAVPLERGLFQGSLLSPFLFNVYIDEIAWILNSEDSPTSPSLLLFADDLQLLGNSIATLQSKLDILYEWSLSKGLTINISKSGYVGNEKNDFMIGLSKLPHVLSYKYLGFPLGVAGIAHDTLLSSLSAKAEKTFQSLYRMGMHWSPYIKLHLFKTFIRPIWDYGAVIFHHRQISIKPLEELQDRIVKWIVPMAASASSARVVLAIPSTKLRFEILSARFILHLAKMPEHYPLHRRQKEICAPPWPEHLLLPRVRLSPLYSKLAPLTSAKIRQYVLSSFTDYKTSAYILPQARIRAGPVSCIKIRNQVLRGDCLAWRVHAFGSRRPCLNPEKHDFNRGCIIRCLQHYPELPKDIQTEPAIENRANLYSFIDHYLNLNDISKLRTIFTWIRSALQMPPLNMN